MSKKPFFARFLENQELEQVSGARRGHTGKSKNDELIAVTLKYPSDGEETTDPIFVTEKYPSDSDELVTS